MKKLLTTYFPSFDRKKFAAGNVYVIMMMLMLKVFSAMLTYVANAMVTNYLNIEEAGYFFLFTTVILIISGFNSLGLQPQAIQMVSIFHGNHDRNGLIKYIYSITLVIVIIGIILYLPMGVITYFTVKNNIAIWIGGIALICFTLKNIFSSVFVGIQQYYTAGFVLNSCSPLILIILFGYGIFFKVKINPYLIYTLSVIFPLLWCVFFFIKQGLLSNKFEFTSPRKLIDLINFNKYYIVLLLLLITWLPNILVGAFLNVESVAIFNVVSRTAVIISFIYIATDTFLGPKIALHHSKDESTELQSILLKMSKLSFLFSTLMVVGAIFGRNYVMRLFGIAYMKHSSLFAIMAIAQYINVLTGSAQTFLIMTNREVIVRNVYCITIIAIVVLMPLAGHFWGLTGVTITFAFIISAYNVVLTAISKIKFGIRVSFLVPNMQFSNKM